MFIFQFLQVATSNRTSLAWLDRFFPFLFVEAEPQIKRKKAVWPRDTTLELVPL